MVKAKAGGILDGRHASPSCHFEGIEWPTIDGVVNKLKPIAAANGIVHTKAHDALSDVEALIGVAGPQNKSNEDV